MNRNTVQTLNGVLLYFTFFLSKYPRKEDEYPRKRSREVEMCKDKIDSGCNYAEG